MSIPSPSRKSRLRPVYTVQDDAPARGERVIYQLEDDGQPLLRLRPTVRLVQEDREERYLYRVTAFSRVTGELLGAADHEAPPGSREEYAAKSRQFQTLPFREVMLALRAELLDRYRDAVPEVPVQG